MYIDDNYFEVYKRKYAFKVIYKSLQTPPFQAVGGACPNDYFTRDTFGAPVLEISTTIFKY